MAEEILVPPRAPEGSAPDDLSAAPLEPSDGAYQSALLDYHRLRLKQRRWVFLAGMVFCAIMSVAFIVFVWALFLLTAFKGGMGHNWHILLLGSGLIIPPTIVLFGLIGRVYAAEENGRSTNKGKKTAVEESLFDATPSAQLLSGVGETLHKLTETLSELIDKLGKKSQSPP